MIDLISDTGIQFYHVPKVDANRLVEKAKSLQVAETSMTAPNGDGGLGIASRCEQQGRAGACSM